jgi:choline kinase
MTIDNLLENNIHHVVIVTGFEAGQIRNYVEKNYPHLIVEFIHNPDYAVTNNSYSLWLCRNSLKNNSLLLLDSDIVFEPGIITQLQNSGKEACLALNTAQNLGEEEIKVRLAPDGSIMEISKEVNPRLAAGESIGIELFAEKPTQKLFEVLHSRISAQKLVNEFYEASFEEFIRNGNPFYAIDISPYKCMEIDTPTDLQNAEKLVTLSVL